MGTVGTALSGRFEQFVAYSTRVAKMRYSLVRLSKRRLTAGWNKLLAHAVGSRHDHAARAIRHLGNRPLARCWRQWILRNA